MKIKTITFKIFAFSIIFAISADETRAQNSSTFLVQVNSQKSLSKLKTSDHTFQIESEFEAFGKNYAVLSSSSISTLRETKLFSIVEPNYEYKLAGGSKPPNRPGEDDTSHLMPSPILSNDTSFTRLWGVINYGQKLQEIGIEGMDAAIAQAWSVSTGSHDVVVGVFDTGIDYNHKDLQGNLWSEEKNGKTVYGYNAIQDNYPVMDDHGFSHGTHVSGTIGAKGNNAKGIAGVNWNVQIATIKIFGKNSSSSSDAILKGLNWVWEHKNEIDVLNHSWTGAGGSEILSNAFKKLDDHGIINVFAAGNDAVSMDKYTIFPAMLPLRNSIVVAAHDSRGNKPEFSNYSPNHVDLAAPGVDIFSLSVRNKYMSLWGTSMAAPHVTGAVALAMSVFPEYSATQIRDKVVQSGTPTPGLFETSSGGKRLNVLEAVSQ